MQIYREKERANDMAELIVVAEQYGGFNNKTRFGSSVAESSSPFHSARFIIYKSQTNQIARTVLCEDALTNKRNRTFATSRQT